MQDFPHVKGHTTSILGASIGSVALLLAACGDGSTNLPSPAPAPPNQSGSLVTATPTPASHGLVGSGKIIHVSRALSVEQSQIGEFSIAIPAGWTISPAPDGQTFNITAGGQAGPKIYVAAAIPISDLRANQRIIWCAQHAVFDVVASCTEPELLFHLQDASHPWAAGDAFQALVQFESTVTGSRYGTPQFSSASPTSVQYQVGVQSAAGASLVEWGILGMGYMNNPAFNGTTSLALVTGCEASPDQVQDLQSICDRALSSFRPSQGWLSNLAAQQMQRYGRELQLDAVQAGQNAQLLQAIGKFGSAMQQMQQEEFNSMEQANLRVGEDWIATLGGQANMQDPRSGSIYLVDGGFASYCVSNLGNIMESQSPLQLLGEYFGSDAGESCDRIMQRPVIS